MVAVKPVGSYGGKQVNLYTLTSASGVEVDLLNWGVTVRDWRVPVAGGTRSVVLGFEDFADYPAHSPYMGAVCGRIVNRVANSHFDLEGVGYDVVANDGPNSLHGGPDGLGRQTWDGVPDDATNSVVFSLVSPDGEGGYPGTVRFKATYRLDGNRLRLEMGATSDRPTPVSLAQHHYFNLGTTPDVLDHAYRVPASAWTELDDALLPTGNILETRPGDKWYFRDARGLRDGAGAPIDFDGSFVLDGGRDLRDPVAIVTAPDEALTLKLWTDRPGLQFYNSVMLAVPPGTGLGGSSYGRYAGFCLEDQAFPDAVHHPHFPSIIVTPERPYAHWCEIEIG